MATLYLNIAIKALPLKREINKKSDWVNLLDFSFTQL